MSTILPIATSRVTDSLKRDRLTLQIQNDQLDLFKLQNQLTTGLRIFLPSDDASASQRAMALQRTIERKEQSLTNLQGAAASLATTEANLVGVSANLNDIKAQALGVIDSITSDEDRQAVVEQIDSLLKQLTQVGNSTFASSYLLGGSERSSQAYQLTDSGYIEYLGDESSPQTYVDIGMLFDVGVSGDEVLGGLSEAVRGTSDLDVALTLDTPLKNINGGLGVSPNGSIRINFTPTSPTDPSSSSVIDLSKAKTIGDVARLIESGAPEGAELVVAVEDNSLRIDVTGGSITVGEVSSGDTASELGLLTAGAPTATVSGDDLDPTLRIGSRLDDLSGAKATGRIVSSGINNDIVLTATQVGANFNGVSVVFQDTVAQGSEAAVYDGGTNTLTVSIDAGNSTALQVIDAINAEGTFSARADYRDQTSLSARGAGTVSDSASNLALNVLGGVDGSGGGLNGAIDLDSGLQITNGEETYTIDTSGVETVEQLLGLLNESQYGLLAKVNAAGDGIDVRTRRSGADFAIGENGGTTATDLGIRTYTEATRLDSFNRGVGVVVEGTDDTSTVSQNEFTIEVVEDGVTTTYSIDPLGLSTVGDLIQQISDDTGGAVTAALATTGNGLVLTVTDPDSPATAASGTFTLGGDTLTIDAAATGSEWNYPYTVEVVDSGGAGPLLTTVTGNTIVVDLQGVPETTDNIAASIEAQLPGYTVTSDGTALISAPVAQQPAATTGGAPASDLAAAASSQFTLLGDSVRFEAAATGTEGNQTFTVQVIDSGGAGPLATTYDPDTDPTLITVDLQGLDTTTDAIAQSIQDALAGLTPVAFNVTSNGTAAVTTADVPGLPASFDASTSGGQSADTITVSGDVAERLGFLPEGEDSVSSTDGTLASTDRNRLEVDSVFTTLIRMREALQEGDEVALGDELVRLEEDLDRVTFGRAEIGARLRNLEAVQSRLTDEDVTLRSALSNEIDVDLVETISEYTAKQYALQASLQTSGSLLNLTILDFI